MLGILLAACVGVAPLEAVTPPLPKMMERPVVVGASMTDGFLLPLEADCMVTLADFVAAANRHDVPLPARCSTTLFFLDPLHHGGRIAAAARERDPTLLIAIDYLFWFGYGFAGGAADRIARLDRGLALLELFECPIVVGDFPDMHTAAKDGVGIHGRPMIRMSQVPDVDTIAKLNARLREWAERRGDVVVVPLAAFYDDLLQGKTLEVHGNTWNGDVRTRLMDGDLLHPNVEGTIALTLLTMDCLAARFDEVPESLFVWDAAALRERLYERRRAEREARIATARRRAASGD